MLAGLLLSLLAVLPALVAADNADCKISDYEWAYNDADQSPCEVANNLVGTCSGSSPFQVLGPNVPMYGGPSDSSNPCLCNLVEYNLLRVCALCQGASSTSYVQPYNQWAAHCSSVTVVEFPNAIPDGTTVPAWADKGDITGAWSVEPLQAAAAAQASPAGQSSPPASPSPSSSSSPSSNSSTSSTESSTTPASSTKTAQFTATTNTSTTATNPSSMVTSTRKPTENPSGDAIGSVVHQQLAKNGTDPTSSSNTSSSDTSSSATLVPVQHLAADANSTTVPPEASSTVSDPAHKDPTTSASSTSLAGTQSQPGDSISAGAEETTDDADEHHKRIKIGVIAGSLAGAFAFLFIIFRFWTCSQYRKELRETVDPDTFDKVLGNHRIRSSVWANLRDSIMPWRPAPQEQPPPLPVSNLAALREMRIPDSLRPGSTMPDQANDEEVLNDATNPDAPHMDGPVPTIRIDDTSASAPIATQPKYEQREGERESWI